MGQTSQLQIMSPTKTTINQEKNLTKHHSSTHPKTLLRFFNEVKITTITSLILRKIRTLNFQFTFRKIPLQNTKKYHSPTVPNIIF